MQFFSDRHVLIAPDVMLLEVGNVIWKKVGLLGQLTEAEGSRIIDVVQTLPLDYHAATDLLTDAFRMALNTKHPVYDCLYIALAASQAVK